MTFLSFFFLILVLLVFALGAAILVDATWRGFCYFIDLAGEYRDNGND